MCLLQSGTGGTTLRPGQELQASPAQRTKKDQSSTHSGSSKASASESVCTPFLSGYGNQHIFRLRCGTGPSFLHVAQTNVHRIKLTSCKRKPYCDIDFHGCKLPHARFCMRARFKILHFGKFDITGPRFHPRPGISDL